MQNKKNILLTNIASLGAVQIVNYIFPLITIPFISRIIGPSGFGIINYITAIVGYFTLIVAFGFDLTTTRKISQVLNDKEKVSILFSKTIGTRLILFFFSLLLFLLCLNLFPILSANKTLSFVIFSGVFITVITPQYVYQGHQKMYILSLLTLVRGVIYTLMIFMLVTESNALYVYASSLVFTNFLSGIISLILAYRLFDLKLIFLPLREYLSFIKESKLIFFSSVVYLLYTSANVVILGFFATNLQIGFYTTAISFVSIAQNVISLPLSSSLFPYISNSFSEDKKLGLERVRTILPVIICLMMVVSVGIIVVSPWIIPLIYGEKFTNSVLPVQILSLLPLFSIVGNILGVQTMMNLSMDKVYLYVTACLSVVSILIHFVLAQTLNYIGSAIGYVIVEIMIVSTLYIILKNRGIQILEWNYFRPAFMYRFLSNFAKR